MNKVLFIILVLCAGIFSVFIIWENKSEPRAICEHLDGLNIPPSTKQVLIIKSIGGSKAQLSACVWDKSWQPSLFSQPIAAVIGKKGIATLSSKKEGDLKTPTGLYPIEWTFGTEPLALKMDFKYITAEDKFIDDPKHKDYNTWVNGTTDALSFETMTHPLYKMGAIINYNMHPIIPGAGSAIFLHIWRSEQEGTAGCVALSEKHLLQVLRWLDKTQHPFIFITRQS